MYNISVIFHIANWHRKSTRARTHVFVDYTYIINNVILFYCIHDKRKINLKINCPNINCQAYRYDSGVRSVGYLLSRNLSSYTLYQPRQPMRDRPDVNAAIDKITPKLGDNRILAELVRSPNLAFCLRLAAACSGAPLSYIPYGIELSP